MRAYFRLLSNAADAVRDGRQLEAVFCELPHVAAAHRLYYSADIELRQILEARLLTSESFTEIASRFGVEPPVIDYYEQLFFNVRDRMQASIWILKVILGPPQARKFDKNGAMTVEQRGFLYRLFAYYGGPLVLDALISGIADTTMPRRAEDVSAWYDSALCSIVQTRATAAAALLEINKQSVMKLMRLAVRASTARKGGATARPTQFDNDYLEKVLSTIELTNNCAGAAVG